MGPVTAVRRTLYLHLGQHKTGTSAIQRWLWDHSAQLSQAGYYLPKSGLAYGAHHGLCHAILAAQGQSAKLGPIHELRDEICADDHPAVIVTSEEFERFDAPTVHMFASEFPDFDIVPILYLRRQDRYIITDFGQQVRMGASLGEIDQYLDAPTSAERFNTVGLIGNWASAGLLRNGYIGLYDKLPKDTSIVTSFLDCIGAHERLAPGTEITGERRNPSWTYQETDLARRTTLAVRQMRNVEPPVFYDLYFRMRPEIAELCRDHADPLWPTRPQHDRIKAQFASINRLVGKCIDLSKEEREFLCFDGPPEKVLAHEPVTVSDVQVQKATEIVMDALGPVTG